MIAAGKKKWRNGTGRSRDGLETIQKQFRINRQLEKSIRPHQGPDCFHLLDVSCRGEGSLNAGRPNYTHVTVPPEVPVSNATATSTTPTPKAHHDTIGVVAPYSLTVTFLHPSRLIDFSVESCPSLSYPVSLSMFVKLKNLSTKSTKARYCTSDKSSAFSALVRRNISSMLMSSKP